jgi:hypothetical protein
MISNVMGKGWPVGTSKHREKTLTTISNSPRLQVIDQAGAVMLANIAGTSDLAAILDDKVLDQLFVLCRNARMEAQKSNAGATLELCTTLDGILKPYRKMRDEHHHRLEIELEREEAEQRLQDVQNEIQKSPPSR